MLKTPVNFYIKNILSCSELREEVKPEKKEKQDKPDKEKQDSQKPNDESIKG
jgi:hypothetical protein